MSVPSGLECCGEFICGVTQSTVLSTGLAWSLNFPSSPRKTEVKPFLLSPEGHLEYDPILRLNSFFWCPKLKKKKSVLAKILSFGELLTLSGRITLEIPHGIYASHGRSLAACNISPRSVCSIIVADIYQKHSQLKALCTHIPHVSTRFHTCPSCPLYIKS